MSSSDTGGGGESSGDRPSTAGDQRDRGVQKVFENYLQYLEEETKIKEVIREQAQELEQSARGITATLADIHQPGGMVGGDGDGSAELGDRIKRVCAAVEKDFTDKIRPQFAALAAKVPGPEQYYRYHFAWKDVAQTLVFQSSLRHYLCCETLASREETCAALGLCKDAKDGFHLDIEDFLAGLTMLSNELSRFAVNAVTHGDYSRPARISVFLQELNTGFRLLNLKNDHLRKRFDSLKYDLKKVEEVVYDLSIRGLVKKKEDHPPMEKVAEEKEDKCVGSQ